LYYFNFVQTPFFAETDPRRRSGAHQELLPRALNGLDGARWHLIFWLPTMWWNRIGFSFMPLTVATFTGGTLSLFMWAKVWFVI
jgi:hypothetical protein